MYRVMLVDERPERLSFISEKLDGDGCRVVACVRPDDDLLACVRGHDPELIIIDIDSPGRDTLESLRTLQSAVPRPMLMFTQDDQGKTIRRAVEAGVSAYVVDGLQTRNVRPIVEAAMARFRQFRALEEELAETRLRLVERKQVERAKGILMQQRGLAKEVYRPDIYAQAAEALVSEGKMKPSDFPDFAKETGYKPATDAFIDGISYDGRHPNAYIEKLPIGLKGNDKP